MPELGALELGALELGAPEQLPAEHFPAEHLPSLFFGAEAGALASVLGIEGVAGAVTGVPAWAALLPSFVSAEFAAKTALLKQRPAANAIKTCFFMINSLLIVSENGALTVQDRGSIP